MIQRTDLENMFVINGRSRIVMLCSVVGFALARTPSPCLVAELSHQPMFSLAIDFCRIDRLWRLEKAAGVPTAMPVLRNVTNRTSVLCDTNDYSGWYRPVCDTPHDSVCLPEAATTLTQLCGRVNAFLADRTKMCDCGLLPGCTNGLKCIYGRELLWQVQTYRDGRCSGRGTTELQHARVVMERVWGPNATSGLALATLDACLAALHHHPIYRHGSSLASMYAAYVAAQAATAKTAAMNRRVACMLVHEAGRPAAVVAAELVDRWHLKYCDMHTAGGP